MRQAFILWALFIACVGQSAFAEERITRFHSEIKVLADRSLDVTETIGVISENAQIRRGIYRDLPTIYKHPKWGGLGFREKTRFNIESVLVDGKGSPWHQIALPNGIRTYIGDKQRYIAPGPHEYEIRYTTTWQLAHENGVDYLHWNVNGQDWVFPTDALSATVHLPEGMQAVHYDAWLGRSGETEKAFEATKNPDGSITFAATRALDSYEGMTISLELPQNIVAAPPTGGTRFIRDNFKWLFGLGLLLLLPVYYIKAWLAVGRDPQKGIVVADYHPVRDLSPAAHHFITHNKANNATFTSALLNMAVKGYLKIEQESKKKYTVRKQPADPAKLEPLSEGEQIIYQSLFKSNSTISLGKKYNPLVASTKKSLAKFLKREWRDAIYKNNQYYSWFGLIIGLAALVLCGLHLANAQIKVGHLLPLLIFMFIAVTVNQRGAKPFMLFGAGFFAIVGLQNSAFTLFNSNVMIWLSLFVAGLFLLFHYLLKAPTPFGQKILDEIEGFRLYLATAEQNRLDILHPPEKTPELFEKLLPYAIALGVENQWSEQFTEVFKQHKEQGKEYRPGWYGGSYRGGFNASSIGSAIGAGLAGSVAAASTAPSSSSGGGFSGGAGGGGGGGGGGGW